MKLSRRFADKIRRRDAQKISDSIEGIGGFEEGAVKLPELALHRPELALKDRLQHGRNWCEGHCCYK